MNGEEKNTEIFEQTNDHTQTTDISEQAEKSTRVRVYKVAFMCLAAAVFGGVLAVLRSLVLFGDYSPIIALYPNGTVNTALWVCTALFGALLFSLAFLFLRGDEKYKINYSGIGMTFAGSLLSFSFAALAFSIIVISKKDEVSLSTLDSVLIALSLVAAVAFFADAFAKRDVLGVDASVVLKLFAAICCLFITFYFYFDATTAIHNTNKKFATLAFTAALLSILYGAKAFLKKTNKAFFVAVNLLCVCYSLAYAVPNLVWYFREGSPLLLNVFFDVVCIALGIFGGMTLLCFERADDQELVSETEEESSLQTSDTENEKDTPDTETEQVSETIEEE